MSQTQLVASLPRALPNREPAPKATTKAEQVANGLRRIHENLISPRQQIAEVCRSSKDGWTWIARTIAASSPVRRDWFLMDGATGDARRAQVRADLATFPALEVLQSLHEFALQAFNAPSNRAQVRLLIGLMIDAFPNARPHSPETFYETLAHELDATGYAPVAVACALREIVRKKTFVPSIAEALEACEAEASLQRYHAKDLARGIEARLWLTEAASVCAAYEAGERLTHPADPPPTPWKEGDSLPF